MGANATTPPDSDPGQSLEGDPTPLSARAPAIGEDVATLKQALAQQEVELQALRSHLQSLGRAEAEAGLGCWTFDLQAGTGWWSEEMHTLFGRDPHRGVPSNEAYLALIHPEDRALLAQTLADLAQGRPPEQWDFRTNPARGPARTLRPRYHIERDEAGNALRLVGTVLDVTEQREAEGKLGAQKRRYRLLFETIVQGVVYYAADGAIIDANPAAQHILGLTLAQLQGRTSFAPSWRAVRPDGSDFPSDEHPAIIALRLGTPVLGAVIGVDHARSQSRRWISINAIPLIHPGESTPYQVYATLEDITARKQAQQELQELNHTSRRGCRSAQSRCGNSTISSVRQTPSSSEPHRPRTSFWPI